MDLQGKAMNFCFGLVSNEKLISSFVEEKYAEKVKFQDPIFKPVRYFNKCTPCRKTEIFTGTTR